MRKLAHRAVIAGASVLTIMSAIGGADLLGQAHADPLCVTNGTEPCQPQADPPRGRPAASGPAARTPLSDCVPAGGENWGFLLSAASVISAVFFRLE
jgi:hypothetical protein